MNERQASFLICDEMLVSLNGKFFLQGVYTGDIAIPNEQSRIPQLVFLLQIGTPFEKPFRSLKLSISLPGESEPRILDLLAALPAMIAQPGRSYANFKIPFPVMGPVLTPGPIEVRVLHEEGEIFAGRQWIITQPSTSVLSPSIRPPEG